MRCLSASSSSWSSALVRLTEAMGIAGGPCTGEHAYALRVATERARRRARAPACPRAGPPHSLTRGQGGSQGLRPSGAEDAEQSVTGRNRLQFQAVNAVVEQAALRQVIANRRAEGAQGADDHLGAFSS